MIRTTFSAASRPGNLGNDLQGTDMDCKKDANLAGCSCSYEPCSRKGVCCDGLRYHLRNRELPACAFSAEAERTYDRSFEHFARLVSDGRV